MKIYIKNMVCIRCKMVVKSELEKLGLHYIVVDLGEAEIMENISKEQLDALAPPTLTNPYPHAVISKEFANA